MDDVIDMTTSSTKNNVDGFDVTVLRPDAVVRCVLFAAGRGGNPTRHLGLLHTLAARGALVVAPHFEMLESPVPTKAELMERGRRLALAMHRYGLPDLPIGGVGHSIGAVVLLMLAGAAAVTLAGDPVIFTAERSFDRLVLMTPPTDFFRSPGALAPITIPLQVWVGGKDRITPPAQAGFLKAALAGRAHVDVRLVEDAGHFTFMNELPPGVTDSHPARGAFLQSLGDEVSRFLGASRDGG
jgi:pimeloyl-ACP methyl ester carboxylesterase